MASKIFGALYLEFLSIPPLQRANPWRRLTTASSSKHPSGSITTSTSCLSVCSRKFAWSWRIPRELERCFGKDRGKIVASRRWARARRTIRLKSTAAAGPAPAWRCAICLIRSGRATANRKAARICTFCKIRGIDIFGIWNERACGWLPLKRSTLRDTLRAPGVNEVTLVEEENKYRPHSIPPRLRGRREGTCVPLL